MASNVNSLTRCVEVILFLLILTNDRLCDNISIKFDVLNISRMYDMCQTHQEAMMNESNQLFTLAQALADPLRLVILQHLMEGPATVSELQSRTGRSQS